MTIQHRVLGAFGALTITAAMEPDDSSDPRDSDCYSGADITAFQNGSWRYVGIVVTVRLGGAEIGSDSLWGTEYGTLGNGVECQPLTGSNHPLPEVLGEALGEAWSWVEQFCGDDSAAADLLRRAEELHTTLSAGSDRR